MFQISLANISETIELWIQVFWVTSVQYDLRNTLPKSCPFLLLHPVYTHIQIQIHTVVLPRCGEIFRPFRPALRSTQPPVQRVPGLSGGKVRRAADHSSPSSAAVMEEQSYTSTHLLGHTKACNGITLPFIVVLQGKFTLASLSPYIMNTNRPYI